MALDDDSVQLPFTIPLHTIKELSDSGFLVAHDLPGIDDILPGDVGSRGYGGYRVHVGECNPYGEYGVFLAETLTAGNGVAETASDHSSNFKL